MKKYRNMIKLLVLFLLIIAAITLLENSRKRSVAQTNQPTSANADSAGSAVAFSALFDQPLTIQGNTILGFKKIDDLINRIRSEYWSNSALVYQSRSLQYGSETSPRVILFRDNQSPIAAFSGDPTKPAGNTLEIIHYNQNSHAFEFYQIEQNEKVLTLTKNPSTCTQCHTNSLRPNWDPYVLWPGVFGSLDDEILVGSKEDTLFRNFIVNSRSNGRYAQLSLIAKDTEHLLEEPKSERTSFSKGKYRIIRDELYLDKNKAVGFLKSFYAKNDAFFSELERDSGLPHGVFEMSYKPTDGIPRSKARVNAHLGNIIFDQNSDRIIHDLMKQPQFNQLRYAYLAGLLGCESYESLSKHVSASGSHPPASFKDIQEEISSRYTLEDLKKRESEFSILTDKVISTLDKSAALSIEHFAGMKFLTQGQNLQIPYDEWSPTLDMPYVFDDGLDGPRRFAALLLKEGFKDRPRFVNEFTPIDLQGYGDQKWTLIAPLKRQCRFLKKFL